MRVQLTPKNVYHIWQWILASKIGQKWIHLVLDLKKTENGTIEFMNCRKYMGPMPWMKQDALGLFVAEVPVRFTPWLYNRVMENRANSVGSTIDFEIDDDLGHVTKMIDKTRYPDPQSDFDEDIASENNTRTDSPTVAEIMHK